MSREHGRERAPSLRNEKSKAAKHEEEILDDALAETFPASDPVAPATPVTKPVIDPKTLKKDARKACETDGMPGKKSGHN
jgi:hypothetical protein